MSLQAQEGTGKGGAERRLPMSLDLVHHYCGWHRKEGDGHDWLLPSVVEGAGLCAAVTVLVACDSWVCENPSLLFK
jgi:hypothetical protein